MIKKDSRRGTVIIEASISLMIFMLSVYAILSVIRLAYTQERVAIASDISAKEISEYSHILYASGAQGKVKADGSGISSKVANALANDKVISTLEQISGYFPGTTIGKLTGQAADLLSSLKNDSVSTSIANKVGDVIALQLIKLNLKTSQMDANAFMSMYHIKNMDTSDTNIMYNGDTPTANGQVAIVVKYTIELPIFKFFNLEIKKGIDCAHFSYTEIWGGR
ncbi:MAG: hypothetical protein HXL60_00280 [Solobacterium sp.]|nr:hypothetical protein [Solobacterium sp.]